MCNKSNCFSTATDFEIKDPDRPVCEVIINGKMNFVHVCVRKRNVNIFESTPPKHELNHQSLITLTGLKFQSLGARPLRKLQFLLGSFFCFSLQFPELVHDGHLGKVWHSKDTKFKTPRGLSVFDIIQLGSQA